MNLHVKFFLANHLKVFSADKQQTNIRKPHVHSKMIYDGGSHDKRRRNTGGLDDRRPDCADQTQISVSLLGVIVVAAVDFFSKCDRLLNGRKMLKGNTNKRQAFILLDFSFVSFRLFFPFIKWTC